jgi:hypothetical protein
MLEASCEVGQLHKDLCLQFRLWQTQEAQDLAQGHSILLQPSRALSGPLAHRHLRRQRLLALSQSALLHLGGAQVELNLRGTRTRMLIASRLLVKVQVATDRRCRPEQFLMAEGFLGILPHAMDDCKALLEMVLDQPHTGKRSSILQFQLHLQFQGRSNSSGH